MVEAIVAEEAANVAADGGLAAASAARAASPINGTAERGAEEIGDLAPAAKRPRLAGSDAPGTSQSTGPQLGRIWRPFDWDAPAQSRPVENIRQPAHAPISYVDVRTELGLIEARLEAEVPGMREDLIRIFYRGNPSNRSLIHRWMGRDFTGGLRKTIKRSADAIVDDITDFADEMRQRIVRVDNI